MQSRSDYGHGSSIEPYLPEGGTLSFEQHPRANFISLEMIRGIIFRQRWLISGVVAAAIVVGLVITIMATPMYKASATVRIEPNGSFIVQGQNIEQGIASNQVRDLLSTYVGVITSRNLATQVAEDLRLDERLDFLGADIDQSRPDNMSDEAWREAKLARAASILQGGVSAEIPGGNWIIEIAYSSPRPEIAAEVANAYASAFSNSDSRDTLENNEYAQGYLREQIEGVRQRLQDAERAANNYARANGIIIQNSTTEDGEGGATLTTSNLAGINSRVATARAVRIAAEQRWRSLQNVPTAQLTEVQGNPLLQNLIGERTAAQARLAELRQRFLEAHPQVQAAIARIAELDAQIERSGNDIRAAARTEFVVALNQEEALARELNSVTNDALQEQDSQVQYGVLDREAQALRDQLEVLLGRYNEVSAAANVQTGTINLLDSAVIPSSPYAPSLFKNLALALVFGGGLAGALSLLRETLDDKVRSIEDVEQKISLPLLGHTPYVADHVRMDDGGLDRFSPLMEAYASIRSTLDFSLAHDQNVIQFTSSQASEGKSTSSLILAEMFANLGRRTLLIDGDLRRPALAKMLGLGRPKAGLVQVLQGQVDLQLAVVKGMHDGLDILPAGALPSNTGEIFASPRLRQFIEKVRKEYSLVIFDSSPMLGLADAPMLAGLVDGTIFVLEANRVHARQVRASIKRLSSSGGRPIGAIMTKYRALEAGESYDYQYAYYEYADDPSPSGVVSQV